jgi:hypothetical protein
MYAGNNSGIIGEGTPVCEDEGEIVGDGDINGEPLGITDPLGEGPAEGDGDGEGLPAT